jgi:predicted transcriptional regulator
MNVAERIKTRGLKKKWIAEQIGVTPAMISYYLSGERNLSKEKEDALFALLS